MPKGAIQKAKFIQYYLQLGDAIQAAQLAGYSTKGGNLRSRASALLRDHEVRRAIEEYQEKMRGEAIAAGKRAGMGAEEVLARIAELARNGRSEATKLKALELAARANALLTDTHRVESSIKEEYRKVSYPTYHEITAPEVTPKLASPEERTEIPKLRDPTTEEEE